MQLDAVRETSPFSSLMVAYWLFARGHDERLHNPVMLYSLRQKFWLFVLNREKGKKDTESHLQLIFFTLNLRKSLLYSAILSHLVYANSSKVKKSQYVDNYYKHSFLHLLPTCSRHIQTSKTLHIITSMNKWIIQFNTYFTLKEQNCLFPITSQITCTKEINYNLDLI